MMKREVKLLESVKTQEFDPGGLIVNLIDRTAAQIGNSSTTSSGSIKRRRLTSIVSSFFDVRNIPTRCNGEVLRTAAISSRRCPFGSGRHGARPLFGSLDSRPRCYPTELCGKDLDGKGEGVTVTGFWRLRTLVLGNP